MSVQLLTDIGSHITNAVTIRPQAASAGTVSGVAFDRCTAGDQEYYSGVLTLTVGATAGAPSSFTVDLSLEHSDSSGSGYAAVSPAVAVTQVTAASTTVSVSFNAKGLKRYIRGSCVVAFSGGTSPTVLVSGVLTMGGAHKLATP